MPVYMVFLYVCVTISVICCYCFCKYSEPNLDSTYATSQCCFSPYKISEKPLLRANMIRNFSFISHGSESLSFFCNFCIDYLFLYYHSVKNQFCIWLSCIGSYLSVINTREFLYLKYFSSSPFVCKGGCNNFVYIFFIFCLYITRVKSSKNLLTQTSFYITALFHNIQDLKGFHFLFHIAMQISAQQPLQLVQDILIYRESIQFFRR